MWNKGIYKSSEKMTANFMDFNYKPIKSNSSQYPYHFDFGNILNKY